DADRVRRIAGAAARRTRSAFSSVAFLLRSDVHAEAAVEGFVVGAYDTDLYKGERSRNRLTSFTVIGAGDVTARAAEGGVIGDAVNFARTLVAEPPNAKVPTALAERIKGEL